MKVSVILPVFNCENYILDSIESILNQSFKEFELIIVNDCSTDNTLSIIQSIKDDRIILINNDSNLGIVKSLNKAISIAKGKYIARMDADDLCVENRLQEQLNIFKENPNIDIVGTSYFEIDKDENIINRVILPQNDWEIKTTLLVKNCILHPSVMVKSEILKKNNYLEEYKHAEDFELWIRLIKYCKFYNIPTPLVKYRITGDNVTIKANKKVSERISILSKIYKNALEYKGVQVDSNELILYTKVVTVLDKYSLNDDKVLLLFEKILNKCFSINERNILKKLYGFSWLRYSKINGLSFRSVKFKVRGLIYIKEGKK